MDLSGFCTEVKDVMQIVGWVLFIFKIIIPLIVVALGAFDLGKAVTSGKEDDIKKQTKTLGVRIAAGIIIFIMPSIILWIFGLVKSFGEAQGVVDFEVCRTCLLTPYKC